MKKLTVVLLVLVFGAMALSAGEKKVLHCFAFTEIETASTADWEAFEKASDELPSKIPGLSKIWHGKLRNPLGLITTAGQVEPETMKKLRAGETATIPAKMIRRQRAMCMEFATPEALAAYAKHEAHAEWVKAYEKVRVAGTTTYDIIGH